MALTADVLDSMDGDFTPEEAADISADEAETDTAEAVDEPTAPAEDQVDSKQEVDEGETPSPISEVDNQLAELRAFIREQRKQNTELQNELAKLKSASTKQEAPKQKEPEYRILYDENGNEVKIPTQPEPAQQNENAKEEATSLDQLKSEYAALMDKKEAALETLKETMFLSPKFPDAETVLVDSNINDIFDAIATAAMKKAGVSYGEALLQAQIAVFKQPNPFRFLYNTIKEHHPSFAVKEAQTTKPKSAPQSLADKGGGKTSKFGEWTAERIDKMDETELSKVPENVYSAYMRGDLD